MLQSGSKKEGFTLIEMSVVVAIIGILYYTLVPMYGKTIARTKETALKQNLHIFRTTIDGYYKDHERWPEALESLVKEGYLRDIPPCPITERKDAWVAVPSEPGARDVYDVKSNAPGLSLDGKSFAEF